MAIKTGKLSLLLSILPLAAQVEVRQATLRDSHGDRGKCTIEVEVDNAAEVEIRGDRGRIRTLAGQPATWRRFECTDPLPPNPSDFKFSGVDGRGRQTLVAGPRQNGGVAVIRIEDPEGGREGYTFDIEWRGRSNRGEYMPGDWVNVPRRPAPPPSAAMNTCREAVRARARQMFGVHDLEFTRVDVDDNPGRSDWIVGSFLERRGPAVQEFRFQCSVDLQSGRVRSVEVNRGPGEQRGRRMTADEALRVCQDAVSDRIRSQGYDRINVYDVHPDDRPGRNDRILGQATGQRGSRGQNFEFFCSVDFGSGRVRSVDVNRR